MKLRSALILFFACYALALVVLMPAATALKLVGLPHTLSVGSLQGTLLSGQAQSIRAQGVSLQQVQWQLQPLSLFLLKPEYKVSARLAGAPVSFVLGQQLLSGQWQLTDLKYRADLVALGNQLGMQDMLSGSVSLGVEYMALDAERCHDARGVIKLAAPSISVLPELPLGSLKGRLSCDKGEIRLLFPVEQPELVGQLDSRFSVQGNYALDISVSTEDADVEDMLSDVLMDEGAGSYSLRLSGRL